MLFFLLCLSCVSYAYGGSKCPDRQTIYPCICMDRAIGKSKFDTTVLCQALSHGESLKSLETGLSSMDIDKFLLYDSYWDDHPRFLQANAKIPVNYLTKFRITDVKVVDTVLSSFACPQGDNCITTYLKRFTAINSTVTENATCTRPFSIHSWVSCPERVEYVFIDRGYTSETVLNPDFFPHQLRKLKALHLPNNRIIKIERKTFNLLKFPELETLDLSHNSLREVKILFSSTLNLKYLDLSYNLLGALPDLQYLPRLEFLNLSSNHILSLLQNEWQNVPLNLRTVDLTSNNLECNCDNKWINSTFHINTNLLGECKSPPPVATMKLRRASRLLIERCSDEGVILASKIRRT